MSNGNRLVWNSGFGKALSERGYAVIAVDLRHHGRSKSPEDLLNENAAVPGAPKKTTGSIKKDDYIAMMTQDMEAVKEFIYEQHQDEMLNMRKMAIVGVEMSAPVAINYTAFDWLKKPHPDGPTLETRTPRGQDVQALILISPDSSLPGVTTTAALRGIRVLPISTLVCVGDKDTLDKGQAKRMFDQMGGNLPKQDGDTRGMFYQEYPVKLRGTDLLGKNLRIEVHIIGFLEEHLGKLETEWRDRRSKLEKK